jgi:hypothetical protein
MISSVVKWWQVPKLGTMASITDSPFFPALCRLLSLDALVPSNALRIHSSLLSLPVHSSICVVPLMDVPPLNLWLVLVAMLYLLVVHGGIHLQVSSMELS